MSGLPRKSTKKQLSKLMKKKGKKDPSNVKVKNIATYEEFSKINENNKDIVDPFNEENWDEKDEDIRIYKYNESGRCPVCGSGNMLYHGLEYGHIGDMGYYPYDCEDCDFEGREYINMSFLTHTNENDNEVIIGDRVE